MGTNRLVITPGEPSGIGPDLCIQIAQLGHSDELVVVADPDLLRERAKQLQLPLVIEQFSAEDAPSPTPARTLKVLPVSLKKPVQAGVLNPENANYVLKTLTLATQGCLDNTFQALVTAPVHKGVINDAGIPFTGHTEFLEQLTNSKKVVMMLATEGLKVALVTTHLPLREVPDAITEELLIDIIHVLHTDLQQSFALDNPHILVTGLNPHAGEGGHMGREEIDLIIPVLNKLRAENINLTGPLPADTLFTEKYLTDADAVLAMYHDQGLPVLKYKGFGNSANITLGMPIIRTSVDHGTAIELAGTGKADAGSLLTAIDYAGIMASNRNLSA